MDRTRRGMLGALGAALAAVSAGCLGGSEGASDAGAVVMSFPEFGATDEGALWVDIRVENESAEPAAAACYVHAVEAGETHTEARWFELAGGEVVTQRVVFRDVDGDSFWENGGKINGNVA